MSICWYNNFGDIMKSIYYDGTKLLSLLDINGKKPEIYICTSNRNAGKTVFFNKYAVNRFLKKNLKFTLIYRFKYELNDVANKFFNEIQKLFFSEYIMSSQSKLAGAYHELFLQKKSEQNNKSCGYAIALNCAEQLKKCSHLLNDTELMIFDEFQSETEKYTTNEINKFISVHTSIARGNGSQCKYLPVILIGNNVSLLNPYYSSLGISTRLSKNTNFLRGNGYVLEQGFNTNASKLNKNSSFNQAFEFNEYINYATEKQYLNDNLTFIEQPRGKSRYLATIKYKNKYFGIFEYENIGIIYCTTKYDKSFPLKLCLTANDISLNFVMIKNYDAFLNLMRYYFNHGCFRFQNLECKEAIIKSLAY